LGFNVSADCPTDRVCRQLPGQKQESAALYGLGIGTYCFRGTVSLDDFLVHFFLSIFKEPGKIL
jgi:hypothetical protein